MTSLGSSETTPLLENNPRPSRNVDSPAQHEVQLPAIQPAVGRLKRDGIPSEDSWCPTGLSVAEETAYMMIVLAQTCAASNQPSRPQDDLWDQWEHDLNEAQIFEQAQKRILRLWNSFVSQPRSNAEISLLFWQKFPLEEGREGMVQAIDFHEYFPEHLLRHPMFTMSLTYFWKRGSQLQDLGDLPVVERTVARFDAVATPRALHSLDLALYLAFLAILSRYALLPRATDEIARASPPSAQEWLLMIYSLSRVVNGWSFSTVSFILTLLSIGISLSPTPGLSEVGYSLVLIALSMHVLQLHLYHPPTPILLFPPEQMLPLASLLWHGTSRIFIPVTLFFLPAMLLTVFLLSLSLSDVVGFIMPFAVEPSPLEARFAFVALFTILFTLLICSLVMLVLVYPTLSSGAETTNSWDRYSVSIGLSARKAFANSTVAYSTPYFFVPPFNLLQLLFIRVPVLIIALTRTKGLETRLRVVEKSLWRLSIGILCWVIASLWLWNLV